MEREKKSKRQRKRGLYCNVLYCIVFYFLQYGLSTLGKTISMNIVKPMQYPMRIARADSVVKLNQIIVIDFVANSKKVGQRAKQHAN